MDYVVASQLNDEVRRKLALPSSGDVSATRGRSREKGRSSEQKLRSKSRGRKKKSKVVGMRETRSLETRMYIQGGRW